MERNEVIGFLQALYRSTKTCADHLRSEELRLLHVDTAVERFVASKLADDWVVLVTGNPGDGKSHLLLAVRERLARAGIEFILDANERSDADLMTFIDRRLQTGKGAAIAINEGTLFDLLRSAGSAAWARTVHEQLTRPLSYRGEELDLPLKILVVDLNLRNNLSPTTLSSVVERFIGSIQPCSLCPAAGCSAVRNARRLRDPDIRQRLVQMMSRVAVTGIHATMRDVQAFASFLVFGGQSCEVAASGRNGNKDYFTLAFDGGVGPLFDAVRRLDPRNIPHPTLDDRLWRGPMKASEWIGEEFARPALPMGQAVMDRLVAFERLKRCALFEHRSGEAILRERHGPEAAFERVLRESSELGTEHIVRRLNRFFDRHEDRGDSLFLWTTHRYDARATRYAATLWTLPASRLEILRPTVVTHLKDAFPDYYPDHILLVARGRAPYEGLRIDRALFTMLESVEQGLPPTYQTAEPARRIGAFYDTLARAADPSEGHVHAIHLIDMETGNKMQLRVNTRRRVYEAG